MQVDPTGKRNGRGAYLHASRACWDLALRRKALQHALKVEITEGDRAALDAYRDALPPDEPSETEQPEQQQRTIPESDESKVR